MLSGYFQIHLIFTRNFFRKFRTTVLACVCVCVCVCCIFHLSFKFSLYVMFLTKFCESMHICMFNIFNSIFLWLCYLVMEIFIFILNYGIFIMYTNFSASFFNLVALILFVLSVFILLKFTKHNFALIVVFLYFNK